MIMTQFFDDIIYNHCILHLNVTATLYSQVGNAYMESSPWEGSLGRPIRDSSHIFVQYTYVIAKTAMKRNTGVINHVLAA